MKIMPIEEKIKLTDQLFFEKNDVSKPKTFDYLNNTLKFSDGGELFFENTDFETLFFTDSRMQNISYNSIQGFGFRSIKGETIGYSNSDKITLENIINASKTVDSIIKTSSENKSVSFKSKIIKPLYTSKNPLTNLDLSKKIALINQINEFARKSDNRVIQVSISLVGSFTSIQILKKDFENYADIRF